MLKQITENTNTPVDTVDWSILINNLINWCVSTGIKLILGLVILFVSYKIINSLSKKLYKSFKKNNIDETISKVVSSSIKVALKLVVLVIFIGYIGIETASVSAVITTIGVGISLAIQGALSNFAGGLIIIITRPFKIGDWITTNGEAGTVENIKMFYTELKTADNKVVYVPNGTLANNVIVNVSAKEVRRVDMIFKVSYETDLKQASSILLNMLMANEMVYKEPMPFINVSEFLASSINITVRAWTKSQDYWTVYWYMMNNVKDEFDKIGIEIPIEKLDIMLK